MAGDCDGSEGISESSRVREEGGEPGSTPWASRSSAQDVKREKSDAEKGISLTSREIAELERQERVLGFVDPVEVVSSSRSDRALRTKAEFERVSTKSFELRETVHLVWWLAVSLFVSS